MRHAQQFFLRQYSNLSISKTFLNSSTMTNMKALWSNGGGRGLADVSSNQALTCHSTPNTLQTRQTKYEQTPQKVSTIPLVPHPPCALEINVDTELYGLHNNSSLFQSVSYCDMFQHCTWSSSSISYKITYRIHKCTMPDIFKGKQTVRSGVFIWTNSITVQH